MLDLLVDPDQYAFYLKQYSGGIALGVTFGMSIEAAELETSHLLSNTAAVGADVCLFLLSILTRLNNLYSYSLVFGPSSMFSY